MADSRAPLCQTVAGLWQWVGSRRTAAVCVHLRGIAQSVSCPLGRWAPSHLHAQRHNNTHKSHLRNARRSIRLTSVPAWITVTTNNIKKTRHLEPEHCTNSNYHVWHVICALWFIIRKASVLLIVWIFSHTVAKKVILLHLWWCRILLPKCHIHPSVFTTTRADIVLIFVEHLCYNTLDIFRDLYCLSISFDTHLHGFTFYTAKQKTE